MNVTVFGYSRRPSGSFVEIPLGDYFWVPDIEYIESIQKASKPNIINYIKNNPPRTRTLCKDACLTVPLFDYCPYKYVTEMIILGSIKEESKDFSRFSDFFRFEGRAREFPIHYDKRIRTKVDLFYIMDQVSDIWTVNMIYNSETDLNVVLAYLLVYYYTEQFTKKIK